MWDGSILSIWQLTSLLYFSQVIDFLHLKLLQQLYWKTSAIFGTKITKFFIYQQNLQQERREKEEKILPLSIGSAKFWPSNY